MPSSSDRAHRLVLLVAPLLVVGAILLVWLKARRDFSRAPATAASSGSGGAVVDLSPGQVLARVGGRPITAAELGLPDGPQRLPRADYERRLDEAILTEVTFDAARAAGLEVPRGLDPASRVRAATALQAQLYAVLGGSDAATPTSMRAFLQSLRAGGRVELP